MAIMVVPVSESRVDIPNFSRASKFVTHENHVAAADQSNARTPIAKDLVMLNDFAGNEGQLSHSITHMAFLFAGWPHDIQEIVEWTRGLPHMDSYTVPGDGRATIVSGSLSQWRNIVVDGCSAHPLSTAREAFNNVYNILRQKGLGHLFDGMQTRQQPDNTFLLEYK